MAHVLIVSKVVLQVTVFEDAHNDGTRSVSPSVLGEVVRARELLATLIALERLVVRVERTVVALEVFLSSEASRAQSANESLGWILGQRLLATTTIGRLV